MFFGELRTKIITIDIEYDKVRVKKYGGLGISKEYQIDDISGFKISILRSKNGVYEYLYLIADNKKIAKISEYYHGNYKELKKNLIAARIPRLGIERFSNRQELRDTFSK